MEIDHVLIAVPDLSAAARRVEVRYGLASVEGGRHPAWGTANRIVPLGRSYLELVAVVDRAAAAASTFGRWVARAGGGTEQPLGWAVRTQSLDEIADRLGLAVSSGSRMTPGRESLRWRTAGIEVAATEPSLPFFIEWVDPSRFPGQATVPASRRIALTRLVLDGDVDRLGIWLGTHTLPITIHAGRPRVARIEFADGSREIAIP